MHFASESFVEIVDGSFAIRAESHYTVAREIHCDVLESLGSQKTCAVRRDLRSGFPVAEVPIICSVGMPSFDHGNFARRPGLQARQNCTARDSTSDIRNINDSGDTRKAIKRDLIERLATLQLPARRCSCIETKAVPPEAEFLELIPPIIGLRNKWCTVPLPVGFYDLGAVNNGHTIF